MEESLVLFCHRKTHDLRASLSSHQCLLQKKMHNSTVLFISIDSKCVFNFCAQNKKPNCKKSHILFSSIDQKRVFYSKAKQYLFGNITKSHTEFVNKIYCISQIISLYCVLKRCVVSQLLTTSIRAHPHPCYTE